MRHWRVPCRPWMDSHTGVAPAPRWYPMGLGLLGLVFAALLVTGLRAGPAAVFASPRDLVIDTSQQLLAAIKSNPKHADQLVRDIVLPHFDFASMSTWVLGKYWRTATPEQQQRFTEEFRTLLVRTYANSLVKYQDQKITYEPLRAAPDATDVTVRTEIEQPGSYPPIPIDYSMQLKDGEWKVYDVTIDNVSLVTNYRSTFKTQIGQNGLDALIKQLTEHNRTFGS